MTKEQRLQLIGKENNLKKRDNLATPTEVVFKAKSDLSDGSKEHWATKNSARSSNVQVASSSCCTIS